MKKFLSLSLLFFPLLVFATESVWGVSYNKEESSANYYAGYTTFRISYNQSAKKFILQADGDIILQGDVIYDYSTKAEDNITRKIGLVFNKETQVTFYEYLNIGIKCYVIRIDSVTEHKKAIYDMDSLDFELSIEDDKYIDERFTDIIGMLYEGERLGVAKRIRHFK